MFIWYLGLAALAVVTPTLMLHDVREHRLPNVWTFGLLGISLALAAIAAVDGRNWKLGVVPVAVALAVVVTLLVLNTASRGGIGFGDIKLAAGTTAILALHDSRTAFVGIAVAFIAAAAYSLLLLISLRSRGTRFAFGPFILVGSWVAVLLGL